jgi:hypothetical protein
LLSDLDAALAGCKPPPPLLAVPPQEPLRLYLRHLLDAKLQGGKGTELVVVQLRKLPWGTEPRLETWFADEFVACAEVRWTWRVGV